MATRAPRRTRVEILRDEAVALSIHIVSCPWYVAIGPRLVDLAGELQAEGRTREEGLVLQAVEAHGAQLFREADRLMDQVLDLLAGKEPAPDSMRVGGPIEVTAETVSEVIAEVVADQADDHQKAEGIVLRKLAIRDLFADEFDVLDGPALRRLLDRGEVVAVRSGGMTVYCLKDAPSCVVRPVSPGSSVTVRTFVEYAATNLQRIAAEHRAKSEGWCDDHDRDFSDEMGRAA